MLKRRKILFVVVWLTLGVFVASPAWGYVMGSNNYRIQSDSVNLGGAYGSSASYVIEDTVGEIASGDSDSATYKLRAGYQQMDLSYITLTIPSAASLSPTFSGLTGGTASTTADVGVITNDANGYSLYVRASTTPAMQSAGSDTIDDYAPAGGAPDFAWLVASSASGFGFSPEGADLTARYKDTAGACNEAGGGDTVGACWDGFSVSNRLIAQSAAANAPDSSTTTLRMQAESGSAHIQPNGVYQADITVTAIVN